MSYHTFHDSFCHWSLFLDRKHQNVLTVCTVLKTKKAVRPVSIIIQWWYCKFDEPQWVNLGHPHLRSGQSVLTTNIPVEWKRKYINLLTEKIWFNRNFNWIENQCYSVKTNISYGFQRVSIEANNYNPWIPTLDTNLYIDCHHAHQRCPATLPGRSRCGRSYINRRRADW